MSSSSIDDKHSSDEKKGNVELEVSVEVVDTGALLVSGDAELDPAEALRVRKKIDRHILPLMCVLYWVQFMDKTTLGNSAVLGIKTSAHLTTDEYNWLSTIFYIAYLVFQFPQNLALQRFPVAKWIAFNVFIWAILICCHAAAKDFTGLMVLRFLLGACEGVTTSGFLIVTMMFYTRREQGVRVGYWSFMNGFAQIISGFISFGVAHIHSGPLEGWQWLMIITGLMTFVIAVCFWLYFPDSPTTAWFLTPEERQIAVLRLKGNQTGVENKHFKREQMIETLTDPKTWMFALFVAFTNIPNSLSNQKPLIVNSFGFTTLQTTLLTCVDGVISILTIALGVNVAKWSGQRALTAFCWKIPDILGALLVMCLPWSNKIGLLFSLWVSGLGTTAYTIVLAWAQTTTAGHTKRICTNTIIFIAYCVGNALGPIMWKDQYKPRNRVPWGVALMSFVVGMSLILTIRWYLARENKRRDAAPSEDTKYEHVCVDRIAADGRVEKVRVVKEFLDLTDRQNRDFRYVL
ncbi:major facilitator superfamily domain-containing protein [Roridomyces roridus]|uniref:Major facilitator superfamily domain-containing protein n=1 Tax=Roridomyces roridus TaxID=1738132 RepID=A0AAD7BE13_9AGAR|nr:major facilitator superfamily domain-containing protein [Roridomyces roridus]